MVLPCLLSPQTLKLLNWALLCLDIGGFVYAVTDLWLSW
jgi:hypothetical protein